MTDSRDVGSFEKTLIVKIYRGRNRDAFAGGGANNIIFRRK